jgi:GNAT superfamily N-acetyltransferase
MNILLINPASDTQLTLILGFMRDYYVHDELFFDESGAREALSGLMKNPQLGRIFVVTLDQEPIGYIALTVGYSLENHGKDAFVDEFFLAEGYRGRGIGREVLQFAEGYCRDTGVRSLHLGVEQKNARARRFYQQAGYPDLGRSLLSKRLF